MFVYISKCKNIYPCLVAVVKALPPKFYFACKCCLSTWLFTNQKGFQFFTCIAPLQDPEYLLIFTEIYLIFMHLGVNVKCRSS